MPDSRPFLMAFVVASLCRAMPAFAQAVMSPGPVNPVAPSPAVPKLTVVTGSGVQTSEAGTGRSDLGAVDPARTPTVERTFTLKNTTAQPITVTGLHASCGCTTLLLSKNGTPSAQAVLAPGEQAQVKMSVRVQGQHGGSLRKYAWVNGTDKGVSLAELEMDLNIREAVSFTPSVLDFGTVAAGQSPSLTLTVTADKQSLGTAATLPPLSSAGSDLRVAPDGPPQQSGPGAIVQQYKVTLLPAAKTGRLSETLVFPSGTASLAGLSVPVYAVVAGGLHATPASLFLGSIPAGTGAESDVSVSAHAPDGVQGLTVSSSSPWVTARFEASPASPAVRRLAVTLSKDAPAGVLQAQLTVQTARQERLALPVVVEVVRAAGHKRGASAK